jgi:glycosyltransferase involved in cell wall biosynthesis
MLAFRARASVDVEAFSNPVTAPPRNERLAIVSTCSKLCGIGAYTAAVQQQLGGAFEVTVFELEQYLMRSTNRRIRQLADARVKEICREVAAFDAVNLQLEYGILGGRAKDKYRRLCWLATAAPRLSVTFHSLLRPPGFDLNGFGKSLVQRKFRTAFNIYTEFLHNRHLSSGIARHLRRLQRRKQVVAIVHNRRDLYDAKYLYALHNVFDHPLSFLGTHEIEAIRAGVSRHRFPTLNRLPADSVLIGVFGFLDEYKGFATAIRALHHLPKNYHLLIFGGTHPNEIPDHQPIHPYITSLFNEAYIGTSPYERLRATAKPFAPEVVLVADRFLGELLGQHPRDLSARIHFMGALGDADFLAGMEMCSAAVFPYLQVGQSSSGPISQALELGCRIIASRTHTFLGFAEYHKEAIEFFDIGNHLELAERLLAPRQFPARSGLPEYNVETNKSVYLLANSRLTQPRVRRRFNRFPVQSGDN